jgi:hypothetical protein
MIKNAKGIYLISIPVDQEPPVAARIPRISPCVSCVFRTNPSTWQICERKQLLPFEVLPLDWSPTRLIVPDPERPEP